MLKSLKFVQGAVSKNNIDPALSHFVIENKTIRASNGILALGSPIPLDLDCSPKAAPLITAIGRCEDQVSLTLTGKGRLSIKSGPFKALIPCLDTLAPLVKPEGDRFDFNGEAMLRAFRAVAPFISTDNNPHRMWANGVLLSGASAFATNNAMLVESWVGDLFPHKVNIPRAAVREILRIGEPPTHAQMVADNNITFHYSGDRWLRTQLATSTWPDLSRILDAPSNQILINEKLFEGLQIIKPFVDDFGRVIFNSDGIATHTNIDDGASYQLPMMHTEGVYNIEMLALLKGTATSCDFTTYPKPCIFNGDKLRGAIIGLKSQ